jgi:hypothetical protein
MRAEEERYVGYARLWHITEGNLEISDDRAGCHDGRRATLTRSFDASIGVLVDEISSPWTSRQYARSSGCFLNPGSLRVADWRQNRTTGPAHRGAAALAHRWIAHS